MFLFLTLTSMFTEVPQVCVMHNVENTVLGVFAKLCQSSTFILIEKRYIDIWPNLQTLCLLRAQIKATAF